MPRSSWSAWWRAKDDCAPRSPACKDHDFDYVFIDCPPSLGLLTINALVAAPEVLIPIQCEYYALEGVGQLLRNIEMVKAHLNPDLNVSTVILTMYDGRTRLADQVADDVRAHFGDKVLRTVIPRSVKVSEAPGLRHDDSRLRPGFAGCDELPGRQPRDRRAPMSACAKWGHPAGQGTSDTDERSGRTRPRGDRMTQPKGKRSGLGRGLASLIPTGPADGDHSSLGRMGDAAADVVIGGRRIPTPSVRSTARSTRRRSIPTRSSRARSSTRRRYAELVHSIREFGLMQPIVVRAMPGESTPRYQLVMGERRWRAAQQAGLATIPAIVRETADESMLRDALLENIHRAQLNPLEEAAAYQQLLDEFGVTHDELAARIGRSRPLITNMIRLLRLPIAVQRRVAAGVLSAGHARALLSLEGGPEQQEELAARIVAEGLSVRATEEAVTLANRAGARDTHGAAPQADSHAGPPGCC